jgi:hypothetical protein
MITSGVGESLIVNLVGVVYPALITLKALESKDIGFKRALIAYWIIFGLFFILE